MTTLITEHRLREAIETSSFIRDGSLTSVEGIKVDLHMGSRVLRHKYSQPINIDELSATERSALSVAPGEVAFVLTREQLHLPHDIMATLTPKRTLAHNGIIVLGGLGVDPGYKGVLWLGLYNISTTNYPLAKDQKLIAATFFKLGDQELDFVEDVVSEPVTDFPDTLISMISRYKPIEIKGLQDELEEARRDINSLRTEFTNDKTWREDFRRSLDAHNHQIEENNKQIAGISRLLQEEITSRIQSDKETRDELANVSRGFANLRNWRSVALTVGALLLGALLTWLVTELLDSDSTTTPSVIYAYPPPAPQPVPAPTAR